MKILLLLAFAVALASCQRGDEALRTAQGFADQHYVRIDLPAAKEYTTGLATKKIEEEEGLIAGLAPDEENTRPRVHYTLLERRPEGDDRVSFLFQGEARGQDASDVFTRKWLVTVKRDGAAWKVSNFHEYD
jgi:hypothetical protein